MVHSVDAYFHENEWNHSPISSNLTFTYTDFRSELKLNYFLKSSSFNLITLLPEYSQTCIYWTCVV